MPPRRAEARRLACLLAAMWAWAPGLWAGQMDSATFFQLRRGMSEAEVRLRAGPPDAVTAPGDVVDIRTRRVIGPHGQDFGVQRSARELVIKELHYIPEPGHHDPYLTVVTIKAGRVWELSRTKVFSRYDPRAPAVGGPDAGVPDVEIKRRQAEQTLRAAEDYAETRARLLEGAPPEPPLPATEAPVYRDERPDGSVYFGDRPPEAGD